MNKLIYIIAKSKKEADNKLCSKNDQKRWDNKKHGMVC